MVETPIPQLGEPPRTPDKYTRKSPDMTGPEAANRVLFINIGFFKYGTDDKVHAGAVVLSVILLLFWAIIGIVGLFTLNTEAYKTALGAFGSAFSFISGLALGRGSTLKARKKQSSDD